MLIRRLLEWRAGLDLVPCVALGDALPRCPLARHGHFIQLLSITDSLAILLSFSMFICRTVSAVSVLMSKNQLSAIESCCSAAAISLLFA